GLALNQRAFPGLRFDPTRDVPKGYSLAARVVPLGPTKIPGQPDGVQVTTEAGEDYGSKVNNIGQGRISPNKKTGKVTFDAGTMWHSAKSPTGWVAVQVTFPYEVELTRLAIHSQHSGEYHVAKGVRVSVRNPGGELQGVARADLKSADDTVTLSKTRGRVWQL